MKSVHPGHSPVLHDDHAPENCFPHPHSADDSAIYVCPLHLLILQQDRPGMCPICKRTLERLSPEN